MDLLTKKILQLKLWPEGARVVDGVLAPGDEHARAWRSNVMELGGDVLCVSQFTLHARTSKGTRPDFHLAMAGDQARPFYDAFLEKMRAAYAPHRDPQWRVWCDDGRVPNQRWACDHYYGYI